MGHKQAGYNGEAACLFVSQPACGRHDFIFISQRLNIHDKQIKTKIADKAFG